MLHKDNFTFSYFDTRSFTASKLGWSSGDKRKKGRSVLKWVFKKKGLRNPKFTIPKWSIDSHCFVIASRFTFRLCLWRSQRAKHWAIRSPHWPRPHTHACSSYRGSTMHQLQIKNPAPSRGQRGQQHWMSAYTSACTASNCLSVQAHNQLVRIQLDCRPLHFSCLSLSVDILLSNMWVTDWRCLKL